MSTDIVENSSVQAYYESLFDFDFSEAERRLIAEYPKPTDAEVAKREHVEALRKLQKRRY